MLPDTLDAEVDEADIEKEMLPEKETEGVMEGIKPFELLTENVQLFELVTLLAANTVAEILNDSVIVAVVEKAAVLEEVTEGVEESK